MRPFRAAPIILSMAFVASGILAFEGRVVLPDGRPAPDATISILGQPGTTRTDADGRFTWTPDPPVPFRILIVLQGERHAAPVTIAGPPGDAPIEITASPLASDGVIVIAEAAPHIASAPASALDLLGEEDLKRRSPARLTDALNYVPGAGRLGGSHDVVPSIRGLARGRTLLLIDGMRVTSERRAGPSASFLEPFFLETVEISRGPGSVAYGSDAIGGIIHATTPHAEPGSPLASRVFASGGAGIPMTGVGAEISKGLAEGGWLFQTRYRDFGDYDSPAGEVGNSSATDGGFLARFDHEVGPGALSVGWQSDLSRDAERPSSSSTRVWRPREDSHRLTGSYRLDPLSDATLVGLEGYLGAYRLRTKRDPVGEPVSSSDIRAKDFGFRATVAHPLRDARFEIGLDTYGRLDLEARGNIAGVDEDSIDDADAIDTGFFATSETALPGPLSLSGGLRYDLATTSNTGGVYGDVSTRNDAVSGFVALTADLPRSFSLTGQVSRGFREPTLSDRYFVGVSGRGFVTGNPSLEPESTLQLDLAVRFSGERVSAALYGYRYRIDDLIERFESGADLFFFRNHGEATLRGLELEVHADLGDDFALEVGLQAAQGEADDGSMLDDVPPERATLVLRRSLGERGYGEIRAIAVDEDDSPGPTEVRTPGYVTLDLGGGWRITRSTSVRLYLTNILDREHLDGPDGSAPLAPGRSALLTLTAEIGG